MESSRKDDLEREALKYFSPEEIKTTPFKRLEKQVQQKELEMRQRHDHNVNEFQERDINYDKHAQDNSDDEHNSNINNSNYDGDHQIDDNDERRVSEGKREMKYLRPSRNFTGSGNGGSGGNSHLNPKPEKSEWSNLGFDHLPYIPKSPKSSDSVRMMLPSSDRGGAGAASANANSQQPSGRKQMLPSPPPMATSKNMTMNMNTKSSTKSGLDIFDKFESLTPGGISNANASASDSLNDEISMIHNPSVGAASASGGRRMVPGLNMQEKSRALQKCVDDICKQFGDCNKTIRNLIDQINILYTPKNQKVLNDDFSSEERISIFTSVKPKYHELYNDLYRALLEFHNRRFSIVNEIYEHKMANPKLHEYLEMRQQNLSDAINKLKTILEADGEL